MLATVEVKPHQIPKYTVMVTDLPDSGFKQFPMLSIDADSYIVGLKIRSGIDFAPAAGRHHVAIGKDAPWRKKSPLLLISTMIINLSPKANCPASKR